jgi:N-glycosylase/DNA lyase
MSPPAWSDWRPLTGWSPSPDVLAETLDGGQSFGWASVSTPTSVADVEIGDHRLWTGRWSTHVAQLRFQGGVLHWRTSTATTAKDLGHYLGGETDWPVLTDSLPWRSDAHLATCLAAYPGLRILRQPFGETLLGFLCSATKQIVQIKQMVALLAERHGAPIGRAGTPLPAEPAAKGLTALPFNRLPTWPELAQIPEAELRACLLGFRARYIAETAKFLARHPGWLEETEHLPYPAAKARLVELPGVGGKVADCVLLFGAGRLEAFPVDTWVLKSLARRYGLTGWNPAQVAHFGRSHFGPLAGLAQQYLFAWERKHGGR